MDCSFCGPQVTIEKGKGACPICHENAYKVYDYAINNKLNNALVSKGAVKKMEDTGVSMYGWAKEHAADLYADMKEKQVVINKMFAEGRKSVAGNRFSAVHFDKFCQAQRQYGNSENKIFAAYMKADIEVPAAFIPNWEQEPAQAEMKV